MRLNAPGWTGEKAKRQGSSAPWQYQPVLSDREPGDEPTALIHQPMSDCVPDLFSSVASDYANFRPSYPGAFFDAFALRCGGSELAWDCGCGNGQASLALARHFRTVIGTDASADQLANAAAHERVQYRQAPASTSGLADASVDAVLVAQAVHWFAGEEFNAEVRRVCRPGAAMAWIGYQLLQLEVQELQAVLETFYHQTLQPWWPPERRWVDRAYAGLPFPGEEWPFPDNLWIERQWTLQELLGYLGTWSAVEAARQAGADTVATLATALQAHWPEQGQQHLAVRWPFIGRWGQVIG